MAVYYKSEEKEKFMTNTTEKLLFKTAKSFDSNWMVRSAESFKRVDELKSAEVDRVRLKLGDDVAVMETLIYNVQRLTNYEEKQNEIQRRRTAELE